MVGVVEADTDDLAGVPDWRTMLQPPGRDHRSRRRLLRRSLDHLQTRLAERQPARHVARHVRRRDGKIDDLIAPAPAEARGSGLVTRPPPHYPLLQIARASCRASVCQ